MTGKLSHTLVVNKLRLFFCSASEETYFLQVFPSFVWFGGFSLETEIKPNH